jgi:integrase
MRSATTCTRSAFMRIIRRLQPKQERRVHDLRHTFAALSLQNGDDVKTVQENLGHATAAFTLDVYGHVSERMKEDSAARMQGYFENLKKA